MHKDILQQPFFYGFKRETLIIFILVINDCDNADDTFRPVTVCIREIKNIGQFFILWLESSPWGMQLRFQLVTSDYQDGII